MATYLQVSTTTASRDEAVVLAQSAVSEGLAGSAQVLGPAIAMVWHEGQFTEGEEWQVTFKTATSRYGALEEHLLSKHAWTNPEITAVPIVDGSANYLAWLSRTLNAS